MYMPPNDIEAERVDISSIGVNEVVEKCTSRITVVTILPGSMFVDLSFLKLNLYNFPAYIMTIETNIL